MQAALPQVSIVLIIGPLRERAARCLASILSQVNIDQAVVLLFDTAPDAHPPLAGSEHHVVRTQPVRDIPALSRLRVEAIETARGAIVAFVEDHTVVVPGWLGAILQGIQAGHAAVGGEPGTLNPGVGISDIIMLINYGLYRPTPEPREFSRLPEHNSAYRRDLMLSFGELLPTLITNEVLLGWKLLEKGHTRLLDPAAKFLHFNEETLDTVMRSYYYWNRCFGHNRAFVFGWPRWRRLLQALSTPAVPFIRYLKYWAYLWKRDRPSLPVLLRFTGVFLLTQAAAAAGLAAGALFGIGDAELRFQYFEIAYDRDTIRR